MNSLYGRSINAISADLAGYCPVCFAVSSVLSFSAPEFFILGNTSLFKQLILGTPR